MHRTANLSRKAPSPTHADVGVGRDTDRGNASLHLQLTLQSVTVLTSPTNVSVRAEHSKQVSMTLHLVIVGNTICASALLC